MTDDADDLPAPGAWRRNAARIMAVLVLAWGLHLLLSWASAQAEHENGHLRYWMLGGFLVIYALLIAVPFVPGVEVGLTLMVMEGAWISPWIYLATLAGLMLSCAAGECLPYARLHRILVDLRLRRVCRLIDAVQPLSRPERLRLLANRAPSWMRPLVAQYRYVLLAILINLPGNSVLGGGGGLVFMAGFSKLFHPLGLFGTVALAVAPVPFAVWLFGVDIARMFQ